MEGIGHFKPGAGAVSPDRSAPSGSLPGTVGLNGAEGNAGNPGVKAGGQHQGAAADAAAAVENIPGLGNVGPPQAFVDQINLSLAAVLALPAGGAVVAVVHMLTPNFFPQARGGIVEILNLGVERIWH